MRYLFLFLFFSLSTISYSQVGIGGTLTNDWYQRYENPEGPGTESSGSALLNLGVGPKIWVGMEKMSLSFEGTINWSMLGLGLNDYNGMGMLAFPVLARANFGGLSCLDKEGKFGFFVGGGLQWNRTEIYGTTDAFDQAGGTRDYFKTMVVEAGYGFGMSGFAAYGVVRYGWDPNSNANNFSIGLQFDFNVPKLRDITDPASEL